MCADCRDEVFEVPVVEKKKKSEDEDDDENPDEPHIPPIYGGRGSGVLAESIAIVQGGGSAHVKEIPIIKEMKKSSLLA
jgi:elongator complex protein 1